MVTPGELRAQELDLVSVGRHAQARMVVEAADRIEALESIVAAQEREREADVERLGHVVNRIEALEAALREYGRHKAYCCLGYDPASKCECGLDAALENKP